MAGSGGLPETRVVPPPSCSFLPAQAGPGGGRVHGRHNALRFGGCTDAAPHLTVLLDRLGSGGDRIVLALAVCAWSPRSRLTRPNHPNGPDSDLIEHIDVNGQILVRETAEEVIQRIVEFRRRIIGPDAQPAEILEPSELD
jgi:hypothetical protein